jgi:hypothetical protein
MRPLIKTNWTNLPLSIPSEWKEYFEDTARILGGSRNQVMCMALKLGGPILGKYVEVMRDDLARHCQSIKSVPEFPSEILGATAPPPTADNGRNERPNAKSRNRPGPRKPGSR